MVARISLLTLLLPLAGVPMTGQSAGTGLAEQYRQILVPPLAQTATVENVVFAWAGLGFTLRRGQLALAAPVAGHITAAVFTGSGELDVAPADAIERGQIALRHPGADHLAEPFTEAVFRFADSAGFEQALADQVHFHAGPAPQLADILGARARSLVASGGVEGVRLLAAESALAAGPNRAAAALFQAELKTADAGWLRAEADPWQANTVRVSALVVRPWSDTSQIATSLLRWEYQEPSTLVGGAAPNANVSALDPDPAGTAANALGDSFLGSASITDDPTAVSALRPQPGDKPFAGFDDTWTAYTPASLNNVQPWDLRAYHVAVHVGGAADLAGNLTPDVTARLTLAPLQSVGRALLLRLSPLLRVSAVTAAGAPLAFLQPPDPGDPPAPGYVGNWLYVELPAAAAPGAELELAIAYHGKLFEDLGAGNYLFRGQDWLPSLLYTAAPIYATYDVEFTTDRKWTVAASGERVANRREGDQQISEWKSGGALPGFGFVLGDLAEVQMEAPKGATSLPQLVGAVNRRPDMAFSQIAASVFAAQNAPASASPTALKRQAPNYGVPGPAGATGNSLGTVDSAPALLAMGTLTPATAAPGVLGEVQNQLLFFTTAFGPFPYPRLIINNLPGRIVAAPPRESPAWPGLISLNNSTFLDSLQQHVLGLDGTQQRQLDYLSGAHALAHQWWNNAVTWASPSDAWLGEGLANAGMLLYEESRLGEAAAQTTLRAWRNELLQTDGYGEIPEHLGPLALGTRLRSPHDPLGYETVANDKGGYVIYMLRELMRNPRSANPDAAFYASLRDFAAGYSGHSASLAGLQAILEQHLTAGMDLDGSGKLDWFFDEYVRNTGVPRLHVATRISDAADNKSVISVAVENPDHWRGILPLYVFSAPDQSVRVMLRITADHNQVEVPVPFHPMKVEANHNQDMLVVID